MIELKQISRTDNKITCIAFVEDCQEQIQLFYDINNKKINNVKLPDGYQWCTSHINHAEQYLKSLETEKSIPTQKTIMWY